MGLSCSLAVFEGANRTPGVEQYAIKAFSEALEQIPMAMAENVGRNPIETLTALKTEQVREKSSNIGIDCDGVGTNDMLEQNICEAFIGKKQQIFLATQMCKMILKIDDVITPD